MLVFKFTTNTNKEKNNNGLVMTSQNVQDLMLGMGMHEFEQNNEADAFDYCKQDTQSMNA